MIWKEMDLIDVTEGKKAIQSSISPWSHFDDASRACDTKYNHLNFAFHTGKEERCPWWIVDLEKEYFIECIKIKNRRNYQERIKTLKVELSQSGIEWTQIDAGLFMWENLDWITIKIEQKMKARYVKLSLNEKVYFHLAKVQVFIRKYPGMILSGRLDAFCSKMTALINAKYLADKIGFKFGYSWVGYSTTVGDKVGVDVAYEEEVFDKNFIDNHSFTKEELKLHSNSLSFSSIKELTNLPFEYNWGWNCSKAAFLNKQEVIDLDEEEYRNEFRKIWNELPLSARYKEIIELVKSVIKKSLKEYIVIHIRNGDNIYEDRWRYSLFSGLIQCRIFPLEIVSVLIGKHPDKNILLLGPDSNAIQELKNFHTQHRGLYTSAIVLQEGLTESERAFFDLMLMISAQKIYTSSYSTYAEFASRVGVSEIIYINDLFPRKEQYKIILENIDKLNTHFAQKSASLSYAYELDTELKYDLEDKLNILKKGFEYKDNFCFAVEIIHLLFLNKKSQEADLFLKRICKEKHMQDFLSVLFAKMPGRELTYRDYFQEYTIFLDSSYAYINFIASQIKYLENDLRTAEKYLRKSLEISADRYFIDFADKIGIKLNFSQENVMETQFVSNKSQKIYLCSFADTRLGISICRFKEQAEAMGIFDDFIIITEASLPLKFREEFEDKIYVKKDSIHSFENSGKDNTKCLVPSRGFGYWCWKPKTILMALDQIKDDDLLLFLDIGMEFNLKKKDMLKDMLKEVDKNEIMGLIHDTVEKHHQKMDTLVHFGLDKDDRFLNSWQFASGMIFVKKTKKSIKIIQDWMEVFYKHWEFVDDSPSKLPNLPCFKFNLHDQSIWSILAKKNNVKYFPNEYYDRYYKNRENLVLHCNRNKIYLPNNVYEMNELNEAIRGKNRWNFQWTLEAFNNHSFHYKTLNSILFNFELENAYQEWFKAYMSKDFGRLVEYCAIISTKLPNWDFFKQQTLEVLRQEKRDKEIVLLSNPLSILSGKDNNLTFNVKNDSACQRVQNHLTYRIGKIAINSPQNLRGYYTIIVSLVLLKISYWFKRREHQINIKLDPNKKMKPLKDYGDYEEAMLIKRSAEYKLGEVILKYPLSFIFRSNAHVIWKANKKSN